MKPLAFTLFAATLLLAGAAQAAAPELVTHEATELKSAVTIRVTGSVKIVLPPMADASGVWQLISNDPRYLKPFGEPKQTAAPKESGKPATWELTFVGQRPGRSLVRFIYAKPGRAETVPGEFMREVSVRVQ
jgi:hypothetical protein